MAHHDMELSYDAGHVKANHEPLFVQTGDTIAVKAVAPPGAMVEITFPDAVNFSTKTYKDGDQPVTVQKAVSAVCACRFTLKGKDLPMKESGGGFSIDPARGR